MSVVTIIGAGMMGSALCWPLSDNQHEIHLVGTHLDDEYIKGIHRDGTHPKLKRKMPDGVNSHFHTQIPDAVEGADLVISGVSSFGVEWFGAQAGPYLKPGTPVIAVTKGLVADDSGDLHIVPDAMNDMLPPELQGKISHNAIGGPCIAHELAARRHSNVVFCGRDAGTLERLRQIFATRYYHISISTDIIGVEVCAAMKNAYAIAINLVAGEYELSGPDGLAHMYNPQAALFAQSMLEMGRLIELLGGGQDELVGLAGAGDLYVTVFGGRNARLGRLLGAGTPYPEAVEILAGETLEGAEILTRVGRALPKLEDRGLVQPSDYPLLKHLYRIIHEGSTSDIPWGDFHADHIT